MQDNIPPELRAQCFSQKKKKCSLSKGELRPAYIVRSRIGELETDASESVLLTQHQQSTV